LKHGRPKSRNFATLSLDEAAKFFNVSSRLIEHARDVRGRKHEGLMHAVEHDVISVSAAAKLIAHDYVYYKRGVRRDQSDVGLVT
jgi:hypothetical protein